MPASDALVRGVQAEIRSSFDRLQHAEPMRRIQESSNLLLPEEVCYLRNQGVLPQPTEKDAASVACRKLIKRWEAPHAYDLTCSPHDRDKDHCYCWPGFKDPSGQPHIRRPDAMHVDLPAGGAADALQLFAVGDGGAVRVAPARCPRSRRGRHRIGAHWRLARPRA